MSSAAAAAFTGAAPTAAPAAPAATSGAPAVAAAAATALGAAPAPAPAAQASNEGQWFDQIQSPDVKTWAQAKGFKDPLAATESAYNLEKLIGFDRAGRTLVLPKDDASPEELAQFHAKLGVPATPDGYKLPVPENSDPELVKTMQQWMHKAGATPRVAEALTKEFVAFSEAQTKAAEKQIVAASDQAFAGVMSEWGAEADKHIELGKRFAAQVLPDEIQLDSGDKVKREDFLRTLFNRTGATGALVRMFAKAGMGMAEDTVRSGGDAPGMGTSAQGAAQKIAQLRADPNWTREYLAGDKAKLDEMTKLQAIAAGVA
jgi:hypothetical protein